MCVCTATVCVDITLQILLSHTSNFNMSLLQTIEPDDCVIVNTYWR